MFFRWNNTSSLFIFFWDELKWKGFYEEIKPDIKLFESLCPDKENSFCKEVAENITDTCDIVIFEEKKQRVVLCEVKHGIIDDRAVAQIQRYYRKTKQFIELRRMDLERFCFQSWNPYISQIYLMEEMSVNGVSTAFENLIWML